MAVDSGNWVLDAQTAQVLSTTPIGELITAICRFVELARSSEPKTADRVGKTENAPDDVISLEEAAAILHIPPERIKRNASRFPFVRRLSRKNWICLRPALMRWIASRPNSLRG